jgi:phosphonate transport system substrate-binding protein
LFLLPPSVGAARARARGELLERALSNEMGEPVAVEVADDYSALEQSAARAHLVWAPAGICAAIEGSARAIYKVVRQGRSSYRAALIARKEDRLTLQALEGKRAAWVDKRSLGGYLLVAHHLRSLGIDLERAFPTQEFLGTHPAVLAAVLEGRADVAAVSISGAGEEHVEHALGLHGGRMSVESLCGLAITEPAPTDALVFTRALDEAHAKALEARLFSSGRGASSLCLAMEAEGFERAKDGEYAALLPLLHPP